MLKQPAILTKLALLEHLPDKTKGKIKKEGFKCSISCTCSLVLLREFEMLVQVVVQGTL